MKNHAENEERRKKLFVGYETRKKEGKLIVKCDICNVEINRKNLIKHKRKVHKISGVTVNMTNSERTRYINKLFAPDRDYSEDVFDRGRVTSGGGYGLGRSRRH